MPTATFSRSLTVGTPPEVAWNTLVDVRTLVSRVSILDEAVEHEPLARYSAVLADRLGPFKLRADLAITVDEVDAPRLIAVRAAGEDRQAASRIGVRATVRLEPVADGTRIDITGNYEVAGRVATLGAGTIQKKAERVLDEFVASAARDLAAP